MSGIASLFPKLLCLLMLVLILKCKNVKSSSNPNVFDFEQIKLDLFNETNFNNSIDGACSTELIAISSGLINSKEWALKILDAWGKLPSGVFSGNFHDFGAFSQCFHIERDGNLYETQYCLAHLTFDMENSLLGRENYMPSKHNINAPNVFQTQNVRKALPPMNGGPGFSFGICMPAACSSDSFVRVINRLIKHHIKTNNNISLSVSDNNCQFEEMPSKLTTLDKTSIVLFGVIFFLVLASTAYDIFYTIKKRERYSLFLAFSFYTNGKKVLSYAESKSDDTLDCLHGIRVISTQWVVLGHAFLFHAFLPMRNYAAIPEEFSKYRMMFILSAPIAVDTFFVISGLLVSINMLKHFQKNNGKMNVASMYLHRYIRLTPLLFFSILFSTSILKFFGNGPLWPEMVGLFEQQCQRNWWKTLLYIQNYASPDDICFGHSWFLAVDVQLYFISPAIVYLIYRFKSKALPVLFLLILGCIGCTVAISVEYDFKGMLTQGKMETAYFPTHVRFSPWLIGVIGGYVFIEYRKKSFRIPTLFNLFAWAISLTVMVAVIFGNYPLQQIDTEATSLEFGLYDGLSRVAWAIALFYIIFACVHGYGGLVNTFLSHALWQPLSRLCYSIYLLHLVVMMITMAGIKSPLYFSELNAFLTFIGNYVVTVFVSVVATLAFESPIIIIEKLIFAPKRDDEPINSRDIRQHQADISYEQLENMHD